jgi:hypothetical protein
LKILPYPVLSGDAYFGDFKTAEKKHPASGTEIPENGLIGQGWK